MKSERQHKLDIVEVGRMMYEKNLVVASDGNISIRMDDDRVLMTPSGVSKGHMKPEDTIVTDMKGDESMAKKAGCVGYITKPINTRSFVETVSGFIKRD